jgi:hypothetical protein
MSVMLLQYLGKVPRIVNIRSAVMAAHGSPNHDPEN